MNPLDRLIQGLTKLPGIGQKTATRLAFHLLRAPADDARELADALIHVKSTLRLCSDCLAFTPEDPCAICRDPRRDHATICVVEQPADLSAIESTGVFRGVYHILHGVLAPLEGIGPDDLKVRELLTRLKTSRIQEIFVATNPTVEGEATATYLAGLVKPLGCKLTRIASGIPVGSEVEYTNHQTLAVAIQERRTF
ncbi:MAG: recombination protein RecR [Deltaproteobacteria bacterium]|nr:recombination protein RecR [Deltaproteobacteria bacterium]